MEQPLIPSGTILYSLSDRKSIPRVWFDNVGIALFWGKLLDAQKNEYILRRTVTSKPIKFVNQVVERDVLDNPVAIEKRAVFLVKVTPVDTAIDLETNAYGFSNTSLLTGIRNFKIDWGIIYRIVNTMSRQTTYPAIIQEFADTAQILFNKVSEEIYGDLNVEYVDNYAAYIELNDIFRDIIRLRQRELDLFGRNGDLLDEIHILADEIARDVRAADRRMRMNEKYPMGRYLELLNGRRNQLNTLQDLFKVMGRRCVNDEDFFTFEEVGDIDENDFIRLESGACWDIGSLIDHIRSVNGENIVGTLQDYPTSYIWADNEELQRILRHPGAISEGFSDWYSNRGIAEAAAAISVETLDRMYRNAALLGSRGPIYREALIKEMNPEQLASFRQAGGDIDYMQPYTLRKEVDIIRMTVLKSAATADMWNYYSSLSQEEKDAIKVFDLEFEKNLSSCHRGQYCVYGMANQLLTTRNVIARAKRLPVVSL